MYEHIGIINNSDYKSEYAIFLAALSISAELTKRIKTAFGETVWNHAAYTSLITVNGIIPRVKAERTDEEIIITTSGLVSKDGVGKFQRKFEQANDKTTVELKTLHDELYDSEEDEHDNGGGLGLCQIAMDTIPVGSNKKSKLSLTFSPVAENLDVKAYEFKVHIQLPDTEPA